MVNFELKAMLKANGGEIDFWWPNAVIFAIWKMWEEEEQEFLSKQFCMKLKKVKRTVKYV